MTYYQRLFRGSLVQKPVVLYISLMLLTFFILIPGFSTLPITEQDEAHFVQATQQMLETGNYFQIRFQEKTRFQKPPGINWLQALSVSSLSDINNAALWIYRLPSFLSALFSVLLLYYFLRPYVENMTAGLAAAFLAISLLFVVEGHLALIDSALLFSIILMQGSLLIIYMNSQANKKISLFGHLVFGSQWLLVFC